MCSKSEYIYATPRSSTTELTENNQVLTFNPCNPCNKY